jgi:hypothetical protein
MLPLITPAAAAAELLARKKGRQEMSAFVRFTKPDYQFKQFHARVAKALDDFEARLIKKLMVLLPPQHGKTELVTRRYTAFRLGRQPNTKVAICSYAQKIAERFGRDVQRIIDSDEYRVLFPGTLLDGSSGGAAGAGKEGHALRNASEFEVLGHGGFVRLVGAGGPLNSTTVDLGITDDLYKDRAEAKSSTIQEKRWEWYQEVFETRLNNNSQQLLCNTRWDEGDVPGRLLERDGYYSEANLNGWVVLKFEGIKTGEPTEADPRRPGEALFPEMHSLEKLLSIQKNNPIGFNSLYQQDPKPSKEALVYPMWQQVPEVPEALRYVPAYYGLDFGFSNDPTALVKILQHNRRVCLDEVAFAVGMSNADIKLAFLGGGGRPSDIIWADSAEPKSIADLNAPTICQATAERQAKYPQLRGYIQHLPTGPVYNLPKLNVKGAVKGPDSVDAGINMLRNDVEVVITQRSTNIWKERNRYEFIMHDGKSTNVPRDKDNHSMDGARYGIYSNKHGNFQGLVAPRNQATQGA